MKSLMGLINSFDGFCILHLFFTVFAQWTRRVRQWYLIQYFVFAFLLLCILTLTRVHVINVPRNKRIECDLLQTNFSKNMRYPLSTFQYSIQIFDYFDFCSFKISHLSLPFSFIFILYFPFVFLILLIVYISRWLWYMVSRNDPT